MHHSLDERHRPRRAHATAHRLAENYLIYRRARRARWGSGSGDWRMYPAPSRLLWVTPRAVLVAPRHRGKERTVIPKPKPRTAEAKPEIVPRPRRKGTVGTVGTDDPNPDSGWHG